MNAQFFNQAECMKRMTKCGLHSALLALSVSGSVLAVPIGSSFIYQGQLKQYGAPVSDTCDFEFSLWSGDNDPVPGIEIDIAIPLTVAVEDGLFTAELDFGVIAFDGDARWLQIDVCCPSPCAPAFTTLSPRHPISPTPYALQTRGIFVDDVGNVGIGTNAPAEQLDVAGNIHVSGTIQSGSSITIDGAAGAEKIVSGGALELHTSQGRNLRIEPSGPDASDRFSPNVIAGVEGNSVASGVVGASIGGGGAEPNLPNRVTDDFGTVGGGFDNIAGNDDGVTSDARAATVAGGKRNVAEGLAATVGGGTNNVARGGVSTIGGGAINIASGNWSTIPGGAANVAGGKYCLAAGLRAKVRTAEDVGDVDGDEGTFVWSDSTTASPDFFESTGPNQFLINATGGVGIGTNSPSSQLSVAGDADFSGKVGIGTSSPGAKLHVAGTPGVDGIMFPDGSLQTTAADSDGHSLDAADGEPIDALFVDNDGNVGIGTTAPAEKLDVVGNVKVSGMIQCGGSIAIDGTAGSEKIVSSDALELHTSQGRNLRLEPAGPDAFLRIGANVIAGLEANSVTPGVVGATIAGGGMGFLLPQIDPFPNVVTGSFGTVGGGENNSAAQFATVSGGSGNTAGSTRATVGGGKDNEASGGSSTIGGGEGNEAGGSSATISGGFGNVASGVLATIPGGNGNVAAGTSSFAAGQRAKVRSPDEVVADEGGTDTDGDEGTFVWSDSTTVPGDFFKSTGPNQFLIRATGGVGIGTNAPAEQLDVAGNIHASGTIQSGSSITIDGAAGAEKIVSGGAFELHTSQGRGLRIEPAGPTDFNQFGPNVIGGFKDNSVAAGVVGATIAGGGADSLDAGEGPYPNSVTANFGTIGGGITNTASGSGSTVGGGGSNEASGEAATVGGGLGNIASAREDTVGGGINNRASGQRATVGGGNGNQASGHVSTVGGGISNEASGQASTVGGGWENIASGDTATVLGGRGNVAAGSWSFAAGQRAKVRSPDEVVADEGGTDTDGDEGTFVWSDSTTGPIGFFQSTGPNQFLINATGGVGIGTNSPSTQLSVAGDADFSGNIGIGTNTPLFDLHVVRDGATASLGLGSYRSSSLGPRLEGFHARGTLSAPAATLAGDSLLELFGGGYDGTTGSDGFGTAIKFKADETWSTGAHGTRIAFHTRENGTAGAGTSSPERMRIDHNGNVGIGTTNPVFPLQVEWNPPNNSINPLALFSTRGISNSASAIRFQNTDNNYFSMGMTDNNAFGRHAFAIAYNSNISLPTDLFRVTSNGNVVIGPSGTILTLSRLEVSGPDNVEAGPILRLRGELSNQVESGRVRFTEGNSFRGGFIHFNGSTDRFHIGVHDIANLATSDDIKAITIRPDSGHVGIGAGASSGTRLFVRQFNNVVIRADRTGNDGTIISLRKDGVQQGSISVSGTTVSYNAFTGSHFAWTDQPMDRGTLVTLTGSNRFLHGDSDSEIVYGITASASANDSRCMGAYLGVQEPAAPAGAGNPYLVMSVGNGDMWVVDTGVNIQPGDYLISSDVPGCARLDDPQKYPIGNIVARAAEGVEWATVNAIEGGPKKRRISVFFESFVRHSASERLVGEVGELRREKDAQIEVLRAELAQVRAEKDVQINELSKRLERLEITLAKLADCTEGSTR